jgi:citrate/tricarballylate utilization protein
VQQLESLGQEAVALAAGARAPTPAEAEVARQMQICNACRYCEGFCAVFPAMTRRLAFGPADVHYLSNLCHNCGACLHACQYARPHEFAVDLPPAMAAVRGQTYTDYAWPRSWGALYRRNGLVLALATATGLAVFLMLAALLQGSLTHAPLAGNFYAIFPHNTLVLMFGGIFAFALLALSLGARRFWRDVAPGRAGGAAVGEAASAALTLKYLDGGHGEGCNEQDDAFTLWRRRFHHLTFYGFALCFAATCVATVYHYAFGWRAPYPLASWPVLLGTLGGLGLLAGPAGLFWLHVERHPAHVLAAQKSMDRGFIALLFFASLSGLALLIWRDTGVMAVLLSVHLGIVMALFATLPYGKFAHAVYRCVALLKYAVERRQPSRLTLGSD